MRTLQLAQHRCVRLAVQEEAPSHPVTRAASSQVSRPCHPLVERDTPQTCPKGFSGCPKNFPKIIQFPTCWGCLSQTYPKMQNYGTPSQSMSQRRCHNVDVPSMSQCCVSNTSQRLGFPKTSQTVFPNHVPKLKEVEILIVFHRTVCRETDAAKCPSLCSFCVSRANILHCISLAMVANFSAHIVMCVSHDLCICIMDMCHACVMQRFGSTSTPSNQPRWLE
jgi:hypothetical protein